jgi:hypothetical protein
VLAEGNEIGASLCQRLFARTLSKPLLRYDRKGDGAEPQGEMRALADLLQKPGGELSRRLPRTT